MLEINYLKELQVVEIKLEGQIEFWPQIRNAFDENAEEITTIGYNIVRLPVWSFLSCRQSLGFVLGKNHIRFEVDEYITKILNSAKERELELKSSVRETPISEKELLDTLREKGFVRELTEHQIRNVLHLIILSSGATFSVPGAGKTTEALAYYCYKKEPNTKLLVVCPKNAFAAWEEQVKLCFNLPPIVARLVGGEKIISQVIEEDTSIYLITYQQLVTVKDIVANFLLNESAFMFLDESHRIKRGYSGQWCSTVLALSHLPASKLIMSGTPLPNNISDLIPQFNFILPEVFADDKNIKELIKPIFVRTTKSELNLPKIVRVPISIDLLPNQRNLYELLRSEEYRQLANYNSKDRYRLRRIGKSVIRLLQLVSNPALLLKSDIDLPDELFSTLLEGDAPKIKFACLRARKLVSEGKKVIIWSNFVENVELIAERLSDLGADYIHGGVEAGSEEEEDTRERKIKRFHEDQDANVLVANPAACAEGISLHTVCHNAIYVDRNYNAAQYLQSEDRILSPWLD